MVSVQIEESVDYRGSEKTTHNTLICMPLEPVFERLSRWVPHFIDEPINGLDPQGIIETRELLLRINREYHTSIFISSHILDELSKIADTIGVIDKGAMIAEISMSEIKQKGIELETYYLDLLKGGVEQ